MLIDSQDTLESVFNKAKCELRLGAENNRHPFRYAALATYDSEGAPGLRCVVLRRFIEAFNLCFFTDERSDKVRQIRDHSDLSLLFYNPAEQLQVRVSGTAIIHRGSQFALDNWRLIAKAGWKSYSSVLTPGVKIQHPEDAFHWSDALRWQYFAVVEVTVSTCEVLQLNRHEHIRASFHKTAKCWESNWLNP